MAKCRISDRKTEKGRRMYNSFGGYCKAYICSQLQPTDSRCQKGMQDSKSVPDGYVCIWARKKNRIPGSCLIKEPHEKTLSEWIADVEGKGITYVIGTVLAFIKSVYTQYLLKLGPRVDYPWWRKILVSGKRFLTIALSATGPAVVVGLFSLPAIWVIPATGLIAGVMKLFKEWKI